MPDPLVQATRPALSPHLAAGAIGLIDLALLSRWLADDLSTGRMLLAHLLAMVAVGSLVLVASRDRAPAALLLAGFSLLTGPLGGLAAALATLWPAGRGTVQARPAARPRGLTGPGRGDEAGSIFADLVQDRRPLNADTQLDTFAHILGGRDLDRQQRVVAAISRAYRAEMMPALRAALASETPAIRVQAAAVYSKLSRQFGERAKALMSIDLDNLGATALLSTAAEAAVVGRSGFLDAERVLRLAELHAEIGRRLAQGGDAPPSAQAAEPEPATGVGLPPRVKRYSCGGLA